MLEDHPKEKKSAKLINKTAEEKSRQKWILKVKMVVGIPAIYTKHKGEHVKLNL